jgi:light-regulated signal transduction histidine kinase (bacteriophytochrome)
MSDSLHALLNYSHITSEPCRFELVDLKAVVQNIASDLEDAINRAGGKIEIGNLPEVEADSTTIRYLLQNMIDNSIKYCKKVQAPHVKIHGEVSGGTCSIFVEDNGIGFDEQYLDLIFRPFQQLHRRGKHEGIGMGLALCRKIVERHEGSITARSILGQGSTFIVRLPSIQREKNRG